MNKKQRVLRAMFAMQIFSGCLTTVLLGAFAPCIATASTNIAAGSTYSMAIKGDGSLWAWGDNAKGQFGDGTTLAASTPVQILSDVATVATVPTGTRTYVIKKDGSLWGTGTYYIGDGTYNNSSTTFIKIGTGYKKVSTGGHTLAIKTDGTLWAWGTNTYGQLGNGESDPYGGANKGAPIQISAGYVDVAAGAVHSLAVKADGSLWVWGSNDYGQLGIRSAQQTTPVQIGTGYAAVAAGPYFSMALKADGTLWTWGSNTFGQLGDGTTAQSSTPKQVLTNVVAMAAGEFHSFAITADGNLWAWGSNGDYVLGTGQATYVSATTPTLVGGGYASIATGTDHSIAVKTDGSLWVWGDNFYKQLGSADPALRYDSTTPYRLMTSGFATTNGADCLFNWAEQQYSSFLSPAGASSGMAGTYYYRYYSGTNAYLATNSSDQSLYYMGPATGNAAASLGAVSGWLTQSGCR